MRQPLPTRRRLATLFLILATTVGCDRVTKHLAESHLKGSPPQSFLGDSIRLQYAENLGAFLSLGDEWGPSTRFWALTVPSGAALLLIAIYVARGGASSLSSLVGFSLILAGGLGNLWDRALRQGQVTDFLILGLGDLHTGIFNMADLALTIGVVLVLAARPRPAALERTLELLRQRGAP
jgi:signal peptidase II